MSTWRFLLWQHVIERPREIVEIVRSWQAGGRIVSAAATSPLQLELFNPQNLASPFV